MNFIDLLSIEVQEFINSKVDTPISNLALQKNPFQSVDFKIIVSQIESKSKSKLKLPTWFLAKNIIYPPKISIEQSSSEITAKYKSTLVSGQSLIDITGGFGVDCYYFSKKIESVFHCERNIDLSELVKHNFEILKIKNISCLKGDSYEILSDLNLNFDWIYIDPSRRNDSNLKVFLLSDCEPNVPDLIAFYYKFSKNILIKTAPILDITAGILQLKNVKKIHIVAVNNEVKELLWQLEAGFEKEIEIKTINFSKNQEEFSFLLNSKSNCDFDLPKKYLYEPNAAIMKSGGFDKLGFQFKISKLHQHSHLYTSDEIIPFPGRVFQVETCFFYNKSTMKQQLENSKSNVSARNFPDTVAQIRKKWNIKDGGNQYSFFTTDKNEAKIVLLCKKITSSNA